MIELTSSYFSIYFFLKSIDNFGNIEQKIDHLALFFPPY